MTNHIFITGGSGCIGHYLLEQLLELPETHLHLLCRDQTRFKIPQLHNNPQVTFHKGSMDQIQDLKEVLSNIDILIHIATEWGDYEHTVHINVDKTMEMFRYLDPAKLKRIIYFSTASILGTNTAPTLAAKTDGTPYVRSKYLAYEKIMQHPLKEKIKTIFPTTVWGGEGDFPKSHLTEGIKDSKKYLSIVKWIYFDAAFHHMHAHDIAAVATALVENKSQPTSPKHLPNGYVVGNTPITEREACQILCNHFKKKIWFQIKIPHWFIYLLLKVFRIKLAPWDRYCINHPHFVYDCVTPNDFGKTTKYPTLASVIPTNAI